jgi:hypothetical protein
MTMTMNATATIATTATGTAKSEGSKSALQKASEQWVVELSNAADDLTIVAKKLQQDFASLQAIENG